MDWSRGTVWRGKIRVYFKPPKLLEMQWLQIFQQGVWKSIGILHRTCFPSVQRGVQSLGGNALAVNSIRKPFSLNVVSIFAQGLSPSLSPSVLKDGELNQPRVLWTSRMRTWPAPSNKWYRLQVFRKAVTRQLMKWYNAVGLGACPCTRWHAYVLWAEKLCYRLAGLWGEGLRKN